MDQPRYLLWGKKKSLEFFLMAVVAQLVESIVLYFSLATLAYGFYLGMHDISAPISVDKCPFFLLSVSAR